MLRDGLVDSLKVLLLVVSPKKDNLGGFCQPPAGTHGYLGTCGQAGAGPANVTGTGCEFSFLIFWGLWCSN